MTAIKLNPNPFSFFSQYMKMMGVNPISHFFAWFIESAVFLLITIVILTIILKHGKVLPNSDAFILFLYLCDYGLSILAISFLVSSFFDKTNIAGLSGSLIYVICFFPFIVVMSLEETLSFSAKSALVKIITLFISLGLTRVFNEFSHFSVFCCSYHHAARIYNDWPLTYLP